MRSAGKVSLAVLVSRILGLVRDQVFTSCFGVGLLNDAFYMAFRIPNLLRDLFAEGALSTAFVTIFARKKAQEGDVGAWKLARLMVSFQWAILSILVILGILFAPEIVGLIAPDYAYEPGKIELTIRLTRILFPFILFVGMAALSMGILNAYGRFGLPASASSFFNLGSIVFGLGLAWVFDPQFGEKAMVCMAIGTLGGGVLQWLVQVPALGKLGYRYRPEWDLQDPGLRQIGKLVGPAIVGVSAVQVNVVINSIFASAFPGAVTMLAVAFRLIQLPIGMFGVAISTAALPALTVDAALLDQQAFRRRVEHALRMNAVLCIPSACGLAILSVPLIGLLFQRGRFDTLNTIETAHILVAYAVGLIGYASIKVLAPAFYALNRTITPMCVSLGSIGVTFVLNWFFVYRTHFGATGLAIATSFSALFSAGVLLAILSRWVEGPSPEMWKAIGKILFASAVMSGVVAFSEWIHWKQGVPYHFLGNLSRVGVGVGLGLWTFFFVARWLKLEEVEEVERAIGKKLRIQKSSS